MSADEVSGTPGGVRHLDPGREVLPGNFRRASSDTGRAHPATGTDAA